MATTIVLVWGFALGGAIVGAYLGKGIGGQAWGCTAPALGVLCLALGVIVAAKVA